MKLIESSITYSVRNEIYICISFMVYRLYLIKLVYMVKQGNFTIDCLVTNVQFFEFICNKQLNTEN